MRTSNYESMRTDVCTHFWEFSRADMENVKISNLHAKADEKKLSFKNGK